MKASICIALQVMEDGRIVAGAASEEKELIALVHREDEGVIWQKQPVVPFGEQFRCLILTLRQRSILPVRPYEEFAGALPDLPEEGDESGRERPLG